MSSTTGNSYFIEPTSGAITKCGSDSSCQILSSITLGNNAVYGVVLDKSETNAYVEIYDTTTNTVCQIWKCVVSTAACTTYLSSTQSIGKQVDGVTDIVYLVDTSFTIDSSNNIYFANLYNDQATGQSLSDIYKCTGVNTCSIFINGHSFFPINDDADVFSFDSLNDIKFDTAGFMYISGRGHVYKYGSGAWSSSSFFLNSKMVSSSSSLSSKSELLHHNNNNNNNNFSVWHYCVSYFPICCMFCMWFPIC